MRLPLRMMILTMCLVITVLLAGCSGIPRAVFPDAHNVQTEALLAGDVAFEAITYYDGFVDRWSDRHRFAEVDKEAFNDDYTTLKWHYRRLEAVALERWDSFTPAEQAHLRVENAKARAFDRAVTTGGSRVASGLGLANTLLNLAIQLRSMP